MTTLMTTGFVLLPIAVVSVVLLWAERRARLRQPTSVEPRLTSALLAGRDEEVSRPQAVAGVFDRLLKCS